MVHPDTSHRARCMLQLATGEGTKKFWRLVLFCGYIISLCPADQNVHIGFILQIELLVF
jgi:hypothetical protein